MKASKNSFAVSLRLFLAFALLPPSVVCLGFDGHIAVEFFHGDHLSTLSHHTATKSQSDASPLSEGHKDCHDIKLFSEFEPLRTIEKNEGDEVSISDTSSFFETLSPPEHGSALPRQNAIIRTTVLQV